MNTLFDIDENIEYQPLAERMRPKTLSDFYGQERLTNIIHNEVRKKYDNYLSIYNVIKNILHKYEKH